jgi:hypothetical protein
MTVTQAASMTATAMAFVMNSKWMAAQTLRLATTTMSLRMTTLLALSLQRDTTVLELA